MSDAPQSNLNKTNQNKINKKENKRSKKETKKDSKDILIVIILVIVVAAIVIYLKISKRNRNILSRVRWKGGRSLQRHKKVKFDLRHNTKVLFNKRDKPIDLLN